MANFEVASLSADTELLTCCEIFDYESQAPPPTFDFNSAVVIASFLCVLTNVGFKNQLHSVIHRVEFRKV